MVFGGYRETVEIVDSVGSVGFAPLWARRAAALCDPLTLAVDRGEGGVL